MDFKTTKQKKRDILSFDLGRGDRRAMLEEIKQKTNNTTDTEAMQRALILGLNHLRYKEKQKEIFNWEVE